MLRAFETGNGMMIVLARLGAAGREWPRFDEARIAMRPLLMAVLVLVVPRISNRCGFNARRWARLQSRPDEPAGSSIVGSCRILTEVPIAEPSR